MGHHFSFLFYFVVLVLKYFIYSWQCYLVCVTLLFRYFLKKDPLLYESQGVQRACKGPVLYIKRFLPNCYCWQQSIQLLIATGEWNSMHSIFCWTTSRWTGTYDIMSYYFLVNLYQKKYVIYQDILWSGILPWCYDLRASCFLQYYFLWMVYKYKMN